MPFVNIRTTRGLLNDQQKKLLHEELTELMVRIEGNGDPNFRKFVLVLIEEADATSWSVAGEQLTEESVQLLSRQLHAYNEEGPRCQD